VTTISRGKSASSRWLHERYPLNCWWVVATTEEISNKPLSRQVLQTRVVLARTDAGRVIALDDRCAHRRAPLSQGRLVHEEIECPYHGFRYNGEGFCTLVPNEKVIPPMLKVRSYPVKESGPFVWIWLGDPTRADSRLIPDVDLLADPTCMTVSGYIQLKSNYMIFWENLMDPAHFPFLHVRDDSTVFGVQSKEQLISDVSTMTTKTTDRTVEIEFRLSERVPTELEVRALSLKATDRIEMRPKSTLVLPSCWLQKNDILHVAASSEIISRQMSKTAMCVTPIAPNKCHWWWMSTQTYGREFSQEWQAAFDALMFEDGDLLERIQLAIDEDARPEEATELLVRSDRAVIDIRRSLRRMLESEMS
jgi:phenylpropionate dioxygenase-like ring-hydroxylating dioxygenase large terminal subunit